MASRSDSRSAVLQWVVVLVVGILVVTLVLGLNLISRLDDGQKVLNAAQPAFTQARVAGDRAGINIISDDVNMADPIVTPQGGAAAEVPQLVAFVAHKTGLSQQQVLTALQKNFPHVTALLETIPLSSVTSELPGLLTFLEKTLKISQAQLLAALTTSFPALAQAITNLPTVTSGWDNVPGTAAFTNFQGAPIRTVPAVRTYFSAQLIPVLETQHDDYEHLVSTSKINFIGPLVGIIGIIVVLYGLLMLFLASRLQATPSRRVTRSAAGAATPAA
jgi:hypothetical protein